MHDEYELGCRMTHEHLNLFSYLIAQNLLT